MSPKIQFIKSTLYVVLYVTICLILLKVKDSYRIQHSEIAVAVKNKQEKQVCASNVSEINTKSANVEIMLLERDEMGGQSINLQESVSILRQVSHVCAKNNLKTSVVKRHFLYNSKHKSLYCWIRKVASTSFTKLFTDMSKEQSAKNDYRPVNTLEPKSIEELQCAANDRNVFKLLIVRHPFQRLVSSYRDRIEDNKKHTAQAWIYTKKIFRLTRPKMFRSNMTTENFLKKVFTPDRRLKVVPTFREFVEWLLQYSEEDDVHWDQYYKHCAACSINYNYILKLDEYTFGEINYIFSKLGLNKNEIYLVRLQQTRGGNTDFDTTCKYFRTLTRDIVIKLYEKYKIDFQMYNYSLKKYMYCVNRNI